MIVGKGIINEGESTNSCLGMAAFNGDVSQGSARAGYIFLTYQRRKKVNSGVGMAACNDFAQGSSKARKIVRIYQRREKLKSCLGMGVCNQGSLTYGNTFQTYQRRKKVKCSSRSRGQEDGRDYVEAECHGTKQKYDCPDEDGYEDISDTGTRSNETHKESYDTEVGVTSNGYLENSNHCTVIENVRSALSNILCSQNFTSLCKLFLEIFQGVKADSLFDFSLINSRLKDGAYENSPTLFSSDMQQQVS